MLFNSFEFLLAFLPATVAAYYLARRRFGHTAALAVLAAASLAFYAWWDVRNLALLLGSIAFNYLAGLRLARTPRRGLLALAIVVNLAVLGVYKYADFFLANAAAVAGRDLGALRLVLPLGISFFTFEQITFLVDTYRGRLKPGPLLGYGLFVGFFPHLIAGPIVQYRDLGRQFGDAARRDDLWANLGVGLSIFAVGLAKKVLLAETFEPYASGAFEAADRGAALPMGAAWVGALAYTLQIFFDFSGYSDMAIGLARMLGYRLPVNFDAPYRSTSIIDFWRRWHMTLSGFLRDHVYIPLGGNRHGPVRRHANLMATMLLGGLWHGAGWTFVAWGGLHGLYLIVAHLWRGRFGENRTGVGRAAGWLLTFGAVVVAWVFFRAKTFAGATRLLQSMTGLNGFAFGADALALNWIAVGIGLVLLAPDTARLFGETGTAAPAAALRWRGNLRWAACGGALLFWACLHLSKTSEFIYYQF